MPIAYVCFVTETESEGEVLRELQKLEGVKEAYIVYGVYDLFARIEAETVGGLQEYIKFKVRRIPKVRSTLTMMVVPEV